MKDQLRASIDGVIARLMAAGDLPPVDVPPYQVEVPRQSQHGDFSTNVAMLLAKPCRQPPRAIAERLVAALAALDSVQHCEVAGPGFINFTLAARDVFACLDTIAAAGARYGQSARGAGRTVQVEFVSANPTGPLHVGHGRGAAVGSVLANLLRATGYTVQCEYYVNDAGRQMDILALSVWLRYLELCGRTVAFPAQCYQGGYVRDIAAALRARDGERHLAEAPAAATESDPERALDGAIRAAREALGAEGFGAVGRHATAAILDDIRADLERFGVRFDRWYSEASLVTNGAIDGALATLAGAGHVYTADGARWFRSTAFGDEKDRVVERENGLKTYFASDIAYHAEKFSRGFDRVVDIWGADHHGYIPRVRAALTALGLDADRLEVVLVQFAALVRGGEKVAMSTRSGEFVTLRELVDDVGVDAARFFYVMRRSDQHMEFDLDLAKAQSSDNPVYYVQYAHARVCSVLRQLAERALARVAPAEPLEALLQAAPERALAMRLAAFGEIVESAAEAREPHQLVNYLRELATEFHAYYNAHKVLVDDADLREARLRLLEAVRQVVANGLALLAIRAPEEM